MRTVLTLTDVTQMRQNRVCIAGIDEDGRNCRPVVRWGNIQQDWLMSIGEAPLAPFDVIEVELLEQRSDPPHTEDRVMDPWSIRVLRRLDDAEAAGLLERALDPTVAGIFGAPIHDLGGRHIARGEGTRSLGTIRPEAVEAACFALRDDGSIRCRVQFRDAATEAYDLPITDLTWRLFCAAKRPVARDDDDMTGRLTRLLQSRRCYLRIGLSRGWAKHPDRCYLQVTGVYTFPSYTRGKTHADWAEVAPAMYVREDRAEYA